MYWIKIFSTILTLSIQLQVIRSATLSTILKNLLNDQKCSALLNWDAHYDPYISKLISKTSLDSQGVILNNNNNLGQITKKLRLKSPKLSKETISRISQKRANCLTAITLSESVKIFDKESISEEIFDLYKLKIDKDFFVLITSPSKLSEFLTNYFPLKFKIGIGLTQNTLFKEIKSLKSHCHYCKNGNGEMRDIKTNSSLLENSNLFSDYFNLHGFQGKKLSITTPILAKWFNELWIRNGKWDLKRGKTIGMIQHLVHRFNFTEEHFPSSGGGGTGFKQNGTWRGAIGDVLNGDADFSGLIGMNPMRYDLVQFSSQFYQSYLTFIVKNPNEKFSWKSIYRPLGTIVWLLLIIFIIVNIAILKILLELSSGYIRTLKKSLLNRKSRAKTVSIIKLVYFMLETLSEQNSDNVLKKMKTSSVRLLAVLWLLSALIIATAYKSQLMYFLMFPEFETVPQTFEELAKSDYRLILQYIKGLGVDKFKASSNPSHKIILERLELEPFDVKCFEAVSISSGKTACLAWDDTVEYLKNQNFSDKNGNAPFRRAPESIFQVNCGLITRKGSVYATNFDNVISRATSNGLFHKWFSIDSVFIRTQRRIWEKSENVTNDADFSKNTQTGPMSLRQLNGSFLLLLTGYIVSILLFLLAHLKRFFDRKFLTDKITTFQ